MSAPAKWSLRYPGRRAHLAKCERRTPCSHGFQRRKSRHYGILFDPALGVTGGKTNTIFAASYGNGVYESTDAGTSWTLLSGSPTDVDYAAVSSNGAYYVTANNSSQLWRYMNGTWTEFYRPIISGLHL